MILQKTPAFSTSAGGSLDQNREGSRKGLRQIPEDCRVLTKMGTWASGGKAKGAVLPRCVWGTS